MDSGMQIKLSDGTAYAPGDFPSENLGTLSNYNGGAETVVLGLDANYDGLIDDDDKYVDSENPLDYSLFRSVNGLRAERVAHGVRGPDPYPDGFIPQPMFKYWGNFTGGSRHHQLGEGIILGVQILSFHFALGFTKSVFGVRCQVSVFSI